MKIAIDAMGGDHAPHAVVRGVQLALKAFDDIEIVLVGDHERISEVLGQPDQDWNERVTIRHTSVVIATDEEPVRAVRRKKDASLVLATQMVKEKSVGACISAGNTGAYMTAGVLIVGRLKGIERPALTTYFPTVNGRRILVLDVGANMNAKPHHLLQYAQMGLIYAQKVMGYQAPTVGLLNVGAEESKGNELTKRAYALLKENGLPFTGNVEARDIPFGVADVVVCDGFSGNVLLKMAEGAAGSIMTMLKNELTKSFKNKLAAAVLRPSFKRIKETMDYAEYGGAPLLGLNGGCIKAHGSSGPEAIKNAIGQARTFIMHNVLETIRSEVLQKEERE